MASGTHSTQSIVKEAVLSHFARRIAEAIYQWDRRNPEAKLDELTPTLQDEYLQIGTMVALMSDRDQMRAGFYAAADTLVLGGIGKLKPGARAAAVAFFIRGFQALKQHLARLSNPDHRELMAALSAADHAAGVSAQPVTTTPALNLAELETPTGVH